MKIRKVIDTIINSHIYRRINISSSDLYGDIIIELENKE